MLNEINLSDVLWEIFDICRELEESGYNTENLKCSFVNVLNCPECARSAVSFLENEFYRKRLMRFYKAIVLRLG